LPSLGQSRRYRFHHQNQLQMLDESAAAGAGDGRRDLILGPARRVDCESDHVSLSIVQAFPASVTDSDVGGARPRAERDPAFRHRLHQRPLPLPRWPEHGQP
jgi:hypothetical protein